MLGQIHPKNTMFLRQAVGSAEGEDGNAYDITVHFGAFSPIIESKKTGKYFTLSWEDIIRLARDAGIDQEDEPSTESKRGKKKKTKRE